VQRLHSTALVRWNCTRSVQTLAVWQYFICLSSHAAACVVQSYAVEYLHCARRNMVGTFLCNLFDVSCLFIWGRLTDWLWVILCLTLIFCVRCTLMVLCRLRHTDVLWFSLALARQIKLIVSNWMFVWIRGWLAGCWLINNTIFLFKIIQLVINEKH